MANAADLHEAITRELCKQILSQIAQTKERVERLRVTLDIFKVIALARGPNYPTVAGVPLVATPTAVTP